MSHHKRAIVVGAGASGLVTAKELLDAGIEDVMLLERDDRAGGVWLQHCWSSMTLTSSKWITEFGSHPMPDDYPDFLTPAHMAAYLRDFAERHGLRERIRLGVAVRGVNRTAAGTYDVVTDAETFGGCDLVVLCSGAHGIPQIPRLPGLDTFRGTVMHGAEYRNPQAFRDKRVLCIGLGESGVGVSAEISSVSARTIVSASSFTPAPRVQPYSSTPFDQMMWWALGRFTADYQETLTLEASWYQRLPRWLRPAYARFHPVLRLFPREWLPDAWVPNNWHCKYWPKPGEQFGDISGNLARPETPTDDILYLVHSGKIVPRGRVARLDEQAAYFDDGSREEIDAVVFNVGYRPAIASIGLPGDWQYRHQDLYRGCIHPEMPGLAFVGMVRPTIGSIPAMAEMQARFVAGVMSERLPLARPEALKRTIRDEADAHERENPALHAHFPHVYPFERWMEEMAALIGCQPQAREHLRSWKQLQAYFLGAAMPLRFRLRGPGAIEDAPERYANRVARVFATGYGSDLRVFIIARFVYPYALTVLLAAALILATELPVAAGLAVAGLFLLASRKVDLFRFVLSVPFLLIVKNRIERFLVEYTPTAKLSARYREDIPDYAAPKPFQRNADRAE